ncbi:hypothetical protein GQ42DRAFT_6712 [Ramicandelaber brevisporus]|nr:hypothetical protein GQ42DRAFT_6712 [Ramicandelaber brevisporus]
MISRRPALEPRMEISAALLSSMLPSNSSSTRNRLNNVLSSTRPQCALSPHFIQTSQSRRMSLINLDCSSTTAKE